MSLAESILDGLQGASLAKYATWFYYKPDRILLDCGEGVSGSLQNFIYGVKTIFLSHGHGDHVWGLPGFLLSRASSMGERDKPVAIYHPKGERMFDRLRRLIKDVMPHPPFEIDWVELGPGEAIPLNAEGRLLRTFATGHMKGGRCLGANLIEVRSRLRPEFARLPQPELVGRIRELGKDAVTERYEQILLAYGADSSKLDPGLVRGAQVLLHEATFLDVRDMEGDQHATAQQAIEAAIEAEVQALVLFHISTRYAPREIRSKLLQLVAELRPPFPVYHTDTRAPRAQLFALDRSPGET